LTKDDIFSSSFLSNEPATDITSCLFLIHIQSH
jgi:hypothetical protein